MAENSKRPARALMFQGTGSDVGKSLLVAGLCRAYARRGLSVRPFKPQNMSNNAAVTIEGGEIGRAQALQARACGVEPSIHMNPVLLKPTSETGAQVIVRGVVEGSADARDYHALKPKLMPQVLESFSIIKEQADLVLVEGAGSASEVNLRDSDIANMGFAEAAGVPVVLIGDIDRGGVIAAIVGAHALMSDSERALTKGYIINKFRGDASLFCGGHKIIAERTGFESFGMAPFFAQARLLPKEDAMALDNEQRPAAKGNAVRIAVPRLARIANFDDMDPLAAENDVDVNIIEAGAALPGDAHVVLLPGTKATIADLKFLCAQGWDTDIHAHVRRGGLVVGLCGGYQLLGNKISDADGREGPPDVKPGLGLLNVETIIGGDKTLCRANGNEISSGEAVHGYEIHLGLTEGPDRARPWFILDDGRVEGAISEDGLVMGSYLHGLFAADGFRHAFLGRIRQERLHGRLYEKRIDQTLDALADHLEKHLNLDRLLETAR